MNIAVCDENLSDQDELIELFQKYFYEREYFAKIYSFHSGSSLLCAIQKGMIFDLVFLSVEKNSDVDINVAYLLKASDFNGELILVSSAIDFAIDGYEVGAAGYLPKPFEVLNIVRILDRLEKNFKADSFLIKRRNNIIKVPFSDIRFIESNNSKCTVHTSSGIDYILYKHLNDIENELSDDRFLRCHRSYIVNLNCVASVDKDFVLNGGERILIRQKSLKEIKNRFWEFESQKADYNR